MAWLVYTFFNLKICSFPLIFFSFLSTLAEVGLVDSLLWIFSFMEPSWAIFLLGRFSSRKSELGTWRLWRTKSFHKAMLPGCCRLKPQYVPIEQRWYISCCSFREVGKAPSIWVCLGFFNFYLFIYFCPQCASKESQCAWSKDVQGRAAKAWGDCNGRVDLPISSTLGELEVGPSPASSSNK